MPQTLDQDRARAAWNATPEKFDQDYYSLCAGAPVMILTNGLGPTLAFFMAKAPGKSEYSKLGNAIAKWVLKDERASAPTLMQKITTCSVDQYRVYTQETLAYLQWLKRFAEAKKTS